LFEIRKPSFMAVEFAAKFRIEVEDVGFDLFFCVVNNLLNLASGRKMLDSSVDMRNFSIQVVNLLG